MILIPFGECLEDRIKISKDYKLIEMAGGIWRLTVKCKKFYDPDSYVYYLKGNTDKPRRLVEPVVKQIVKRGVKQEPDESYKSAEFQKVVDEIFNL